ncbi:tail tape measure protein [Sphingomonas sp. H160509]|uniref:tail tape measure protein n=1 Tax=Sphingomonas sp. H160509 TaxID=2955313 RepID=UPI00315857AA
MDDLDAALVSVRADTTGFSRDVEAMRGELEGVLGAGAERAALRLEAGLLRAVRSGKLGFEELKGVALSALDAIASAALKAGVQSVLSGGGLSGALAGLVGGLPGRATGGPVSPGRAYVVGERGAEVFVPTSSGRVEAGAPGGRARGAGGDHGECRRGSAPGVLAQSSRQVARAVKAALAGE